MLQADIVALEHRQQTLEREILEAYEFAIKRPIYTLSEIKSFVCQRTD